MCRKAQSVVGAVLGMMPLSAAHHLVCKITKLPQFGYVPRIGIPNQAVQCGDGPVLIGQAADDHRLLFSSSPTSIADGNELKLESETHLQLFNSL